MEKSTGTGPLRIIRSSVPSVADKAGTPVRKAKVVNALNRINFHHGEVYVKLKHRKYHSYITIPARPAPCRGETVKLSWLMPDEELPEKLRRYEFRDFFYTDGLNKIRVDASLKSITEDGVELELTNNCFEVSARTFRRFKCLRIKTRIIQSNTVLNGVLKDFNAAGFSIEISSKDHEAVERLNNENSVYIVIGNDDEVLFSEVCRIIRVSCDDSGRRVVVLCPQSDNIQRFRSKQSRSVRQELNPQPNIVFQHPFLEKKVSLKTLNISGSGLAVEEEPSNTLLLPGMIIPDAAITFSGIFKIRCKAQVLFNNPDKQRSSCKCGLAYLDMDVESQLHLSSILYQAKNESSYVGGDVDLDDLWDFFFETGFIYPEKYDSIELQRDKFKDLYLRLYNDSPDIARHVIYQNKGVIYGHLSMFRFYQKTWLMHHHAALRSSKHKAGLVIMDHILQHINEVHNLSATAMDYIACYYRPNNRFADRSFGGASRSLEDPKKSSLDDFAYLHYHGSDMATKLPRGWHLSESSQEDFIILNSFYNEISGGLMLDGLDLTYEALGKENEIDDKYRELGFTRSREFYSLKTGDDSLGAMFIVNRSDAGLNMSSLTNCIHAIIIDHEEVKDNHLRAVFDELTNSYDNGEVPILLYPCTYADEEKIEYKKVYTLTVLDLKYISKYLEFMENLTRSPLRLAKK